MSDNEGEVQECEPEFVDGRYEGCGVCAQCVQQRSDEIESAFEGGYMTQEEAIEQHRLNGTWYPEGDEEDDSVAEHRTSTDNRV